MCTEAFCVRDLQSRMSAVTVRAVQHQPHGRASHGEVWSWHASPPDAPHAPGLVEGDGTQGCPADLDTVALNAKKQLPPVSSICPLQRKRERCHKPAANIRGGGWRITYIAPHKSLP